MRLQLKAAPRLPASRVGLWGALAALLAAAPARATQDAEARVTLFREPSSQNEGIKVIHPQISAGTTLGPDFRFGVGYEVDIVSGATPAIFGPHTGGVDVITSATKFSDVRQQVQGALSYQRPTASWTFGYSYGWESDYRSSAVTGSASTDLLDHNFTVGLGYTHNWDQVCDANNSNIGDQPLDLKPLTGSAECFTSAPAVTTQKLSIDTFQPSLSWTATPKLLLQIGSTIQILDGFQSNPYRMVLVGMQHRTPQEREPQFRQRYAVFVRGAYALPAVRGSGIMMARLYQDSWAIQAVTGEVLLNKYLGQALLLTLRGRYHLQSGASFYRTGTEYLELGPGGQYWTGDRELSPMSNYLTGGKLAWLWKPGQERSSWIVEMEASAKYEFIYYHLASPDAPNADRTHAHIAQGAFAIRF
ncbi:MAG TPA: DUF3570 domain-containing protein [Polyangia bacterium]|nr:DUF3570 domain-containing protein [Polyangia bacterium]